MACNRAQPWMQETRLPGNKSRKTCLPSQLSILKESFGEQKEREVRDACYQQQSAEFVKSSKAA
jgi:hypothetical protein